MVITFLLIGIPVQITLASNTFVFNQLGLYSTIFSIILVHIALGMPFITVILHNALRKVPNSVYYLSEIDDLNLFNRLIYIYLPLIKGSIFNIAIYQMIWTSNDLLIGMTFGDEKNRPLTTFIQGQIRQFNNSYDVVIPATVLSTIIPIAMGIILLNLGERKA
jgi:ABC-type glycerol-3-phosphate transport system permease component